MRWANVDAMWMTSSFDTPSRSGRVRSAATSVLCVCITPLGSPVVPDVKMSSVTSFASGRSAASSAGSRRSSHGVAMNSSHEVWASVVGPVDDQHVRQVRPAAAQLAHHRRVVEAAELLRDDEHLRARPGRP